LNCTATQKSLLLDDDDDDGEEGYLPSLVVVCPPKDEFTIVGINMCS
jgi:hypothetical protein